MNTQSLKLKEALSKRKTYIKTLAKMVVKKLDHHLMLYRQQLGMAHAQKNEAAILLLEEYERQVIAAKMTKCK
jgi:hypothetical protein